MARTLPDDIIANILTRLPIKPLLRFKSVSKFFYSLITSTHFTKLHLTHSLISSTDIHLILSHSSLSSSPLKNTTLPLKFTLLNHPLTHHTPSPPYPPGVHLLGSCNDLVLISDLSKDNVYIYHPSTKLSKKVPDAFVKRPHHTFVYGFGYDSLSDDYKVLRMIQCIGPKDELAYIECKVYSMKDDSWKWVDDIPYYVHYKDAHGALVNGGVHFVVTKKELDVKYKFIVRFDLGNETFSLVPHPDYDFDESFGGRVLFLWNLGGCLCLLVNYISETDARVDLWMMKEYGKKESWVRLFKLYRKDVNMFFYKIKPVVMSSDGKRVLLRINNMELFWFDLESKKLKKVRVRGLPDVDFGAGDEDAILGSFVGSLVSVNGEGKAQPGGRAGTSKNKKKDAFLSVGFKLRL